CGFSMETDNVLENSRKKLAGKNCDIICANSIRGSETGFGVDTNALTIITADEEIETGLVTKEKAAHMLLDVIKQKLN
ncbi:MAG: phosphopantothenoylcysteine decarboxylase, partial [Clostridia bacterium]|nr:phosphopantothenoylcysteine decarboxylase [Clostridia bacterium]